jgi:hypothetical protein
MEAQPWMSSSEIEMIERYLKPHFRVLEWGSGGSTVRFAQRCAEFHSVEHDAAWAEMVRTTVGPTASVHFVPTDYTCKVIHTGEYHAGYEGAFQSYVHFPRSLGRAFDAVIVDGRARLFCAREAVRNLLSADGLLFIHDFWSRPRYHPILDDCEVVDSIKKGQSLVVLQRKRGGRPTTREASDETLVR